MTAEERLRQKADELRATLAELEATTKTLNDIVELSRRFDQDMQALHAKHRRVDNALKLVGSLVLFGMTVWVWVTAQ